MVLDSIPIPTGAQLDAAFWNEVAQRLAAKRYALRITSSAGTTSEPPFAATLDLAGGLAAGLIFEGLTRLPQAPVRVTRRDDALHFEQLPGQYAGFPIELVGAIEDLLSPGREDPAMPGSTSLGEFVLHVPEALGWRRIAAIARVRDREFEVQARASEDWSDQTPLVLLELGRTGLIVTLGRRIEDDRLVVYGNAIYTAIVPSAEAAQALLVGLLHDLCNTGGATLVRFDGPANER